MSTLLKSKFIFNWARSLIIVCKIGKDRNYYCGLIDWTNYISNCKEQKLEVLFEGAHSLHGMLHLMQHQEQPGRDYLGKYQVYLSNMLARLPDFLSLEIEFWNRSGPIGEGGRP